MAGSIGSGEYAFMDFMKGLKSLSGGTSAYPGSLTADGFPDGTLSVNMFGITQVPVSSISTEDWIVDWIGQISTGANSGVRLDPSVAGITVVSGASFVNGSTAFTMGLKGTNGRVQFNCQGHSVTQFTVNFLTTGTFSGFTSLRLYPAQYESLLNSGEIYYPPFLAVIRQLNPRVLRFLDYSGINASNYPSYSYLPSASHLGHGVFVWNTTSWAGTIGGTDTYTCSAPSGWGGLVDGAIVQGQLTNANTSTTPTLNVNSTGAKTIYRIGSQSAIGNTGVAAGAIAANSLGTLVFDSTLDAWMWNSGGLNNYVPLSMQVALCNKLGMDYWFQIPHLWPDSSVTSAAQYIRANLNSGLRCFVEWSNEVWNSIFAQSNHAYLRGGIALGSLGVVRQEYGWYALRVRQTMEAATNAWSPRSSSELVRVLAFQEAANTTNSELRFNGSDLGSFGYNVAPNRPADWVDVGSFATYVGGAQIVEFQASYANTMTDALNAADDYDSGDATRMTSALNWLDTDLRAGTRNSTLGSATLKNHTDNIFPGLVTLLNTYGKSLACYEGSPDPVAPTTATLTSLSINTAYSAKLSTLITAYKNDDRFLQLTYDLYQSIVSAFGSTALPAWFDFVFQTSPVHQWSLYPTNLDSTPFKSFDATELWNARQRRVRLTATA